MDYLKTIREAVKGYGEQQEAAKLLGVSGAFLGDVLNKKRRVSKKLAYALEEKLDLDALGILQAQLDEEFQEYVEDQDCDED
jgi:transcriptional regulator with XRE-family HTH domain